MSETMATTGVVGTTTVDPFIQGLMDGSIPLESATPEQLELLAGAISRDDEYGTLGGQLATAEALRTAPGPEGRRTRGGYVAASGLEHLASGIGKYQANKEVKKGRERQGELRDTNTSTRALMMSLLQGGGKKKNYKMGDDEEASLTAALKGLF
tara:strand:- start:6518 stop:6979 length:462 start_codon:yes stop_codon:yes gene_type:complete